jgi:hypothetical protein
MPRAVDLPRKEIGKPLSGTDANRRTVVLRITGDRDARRSFPTTAAATKTTTGNTNRFQRCFSNHRPTVTSFDLTPLTEVAA